MKKAFLFIALFSLLQTTHALNRFELLMGIQSGAGGMFYNYEGYNPKFTVKSQSIAVPAKAEVLFGYKGLRFGYQFDYKHAFVKQFVTDYADNTTGTDNTTTVDYRRNIFSHIFLMEYAARVKTKRTPFAITPCLGIGGFKGYTFNRDNGSKTIYKDQWKNRVTLAAGLNFEITKRRFSFLIGPNYTLNMFEVKVNNTDRCFIHSICLNLDFRLNLLRPRW